MTGFGRCEVQKENRKFTVELKSVNHRYLDVNIRMPKKLNFFETSIRTLLKSYASRGKVDIFITYEDASQSQVSVRYYFYAASLHWGECNRLRPSADCLPVPRFHPCR